MNLHEKRQKVIKIKKLLQNSKYAGISYEMFNFIWRRKKYSATLQSMTEVELANFIDHYGQTRVSGCNWQTDTQYYIPSYEMRNGSQYILTPDMRMIYYEFEKYLVKLFSEFEERLLFDLQRFYRFNNHNHFPWEYDYYNENQYVKSVYLKRVDMILKKMMENKKSKSESKKDFRLRITNQVVCKLELLKRLEDEKNNIQEWK